MTAALRAGVTEIANDELGGNAESLQKKDPTEKFNRNDANHLLNLTHVDTSSNRSRGEHEQGVSIYRNHLDQTLGTSSTAHEEVDQNRHNGDEGIEHGCSSSDFLKIITPVQRAVS